MIAISSKLITLNFDQALSIAIAQCIYRKVDSFPCRFDRVIIDFSSVDNVEGLVFIIVE